MSIMADEYQAFVAAKINPAIPDKYRQAVIALGLAGETSETAELLMRAYEGAKLMVHAGRASELVKKELRDGREISQALILELGDVLWYVTAIAHLHDLKLSDIMLANIAKLSARQGKQ